MKLHSILMLLCMACLSLAACKETAQQQGQQQPVEQPRTEYVHVGPNWAAVNDLQQPENNVSVSVKARDSLKLGEDMSFTVTADKNGRLWIVQVDPDDNVTRLFPNKLEKNNTLKANDPFTVPPTGSNWSIQASKPVGKSIIAFIVTTGDADLSEAMESKSMKKSLQIVEQAPTWGIEKVVIDVSE